MKKLTSRLFLLLSLFIIASCDSRSREEKNTLIEQYKQQVIDSQAKLTAANDEMKRIKEFQIGRTQEERTKQIETEEKYILELSNNINELNKRIADLQ